MTHVAHGKPRRWLWTLLLAVLITPALAAAQVPDEETRTRERLRHLETRLQHLQQEEMVRVREALARAMAELSGMEGRREEIAAERMQALEEERARLHAQQEAMGRALVEKQARIEARVRELARERARVLEVREGAHRRGATFGVQLTKMNPGLAQYFSAREGLLVLDARMDSPLGLLPGDVILAVHGRPVRSVSDFQRILGSFDPGEKVELSVVRKQEKIQLEGTVQGG